MSSKTENTNKEKKFVVRNSPLTDIFEHYHTRNLYNVYVLVFTGLSLQTLGNEYITTGRVTFGFEIIRTGFVHLDKAIFVWLCCFVSSCASFFLFKIWSTLREFVKEATTIFNWFGAAFLALYYFYSFKLVGNAVRYFRFNPPCTLFVTLELARFLMKVHSFVRTKAAKAPSVLNFDKFLYFLFAPTLIYRDAYPRTKTIDWIFVTKSFLECVSVLFMWTFIMMNWMPTPERWSQKFTVSEILLLVLNNMVYAALMLAGIFFLIFHSVQNLFAEILQFGDRLYYLDWWNEHNFNGWLSKWNKMVQEWLYYYIYRDFKEHVCENRFLARLTVFVVSFGVHEWIMSCWINGFFPFMFFMFIAVIFPLAYCQPPKIMVFNVLLWISGILFIEIGLIIYGFEWYARAKSPLVNPTFGKFILPRFLTCDCVLRN